MKRYLASLLLLLPVALIADAAPLAVTIEAQQLEMDRLKETSIYRGDVVLNRGALQIKADTITIFNKEKQLHRVEASGKPITLVHQGDEQIEPMRARADWIEYLPQQGQVILKGNAFLWRSNNEFSGEQIRYDMQKQLIKASGDKDGSERVRVLLQPATEEEKQP